ncbi:MAG: 50S ribosomal protein L24 [Patescibacteria group bacterium]|nr:50S ribosomal protein L24 [Patescibacteria group bacterium]
MNIKKGDTVVIVTGKDKGKEGKVVRSFPVRMQVIVEGINLKKKHQRARRQGQKGQIVDFAAPMHVSNVNLKDPKTGKPTRIGVKMDGKKKLRVTKKSGSIL